MLKMKITALYTSVPFFITCKNQFCNINTEWQGLILATSGKEN